MTDLPIIRLNSRPWCPFDDVSFRRRPRSLGEINDGLKNGVLVVRMHHLYGFFAQIAAYSPPAR